MKRAVEASNGRLTSPIKLCQEMRKDWSMIPKVISDMDSQVASIRYGSGKALMLLSQSDPTLVYPYFDILSRYLDSTRNVIIWQTLAIIADLTKVDQERKFDSIFERFFGHLDDGYMVTAANVIKFSGKIVLNKPYLANRVKDQILRTEDLPLTKNLTEECKLVLAQHALRSLDLIEPLLTDKGDIIAYAERFAHSSRKPLRVMVEKSLKKWDRGHRSRVGIDAIV